ncbi:MAG: hypothetical protein H0X27_10775 [Caulobacteraceae bacterium]|nr:hypothetical protein [Caulobacteraceae bacterium]
MIYLESPYYLINGVSVFPDHADPLQFYYLPMAPHLTLVKDADGQNLPQLQLIEYVGAAGAGGFLNFDVNLGLTENALADVTQELKRQAKLTDNPRLSPLTFVDGTVKLVLLGAESPGAAPPSPGAAPAATTQPDGPRFVIKIQNAAKPALYGENQATFSVQLDQYGATILEQAMQGQMAPVAVIYSLDFIALRPAFNVSLHIDWGRVHKYLDDHFSGGFLFFSSEIDKSVDKLIEDRAITIDIDSFIAAGDADKSAASDRDRAVSQVYDMIKDSFFEPSMPPQGGDTSGGVVSTVRSIAQLVANGGAALCSKKSVDMTQIDKKSLDVNIRERTAVLRTIYPQGHLSGLFDTIRLPGVGLDRFIVKVDLDNPYFQRRTLNISTKADFDADSIASIDVNLDYGGSIKSVTLTKDAPQAAAGWNSLLDGGQIRRPVSYTYTVNFRGDIDTAQRPSQLVSETKQAIGDSLDIEPRADLYAITVIPIRADNLPWDRYPNVEVEARYDDPVDGLRQQASAMLTQAAPDITWPVFMRDRTRRGFEYRLTHALATGGVHQTAWILSDDGKIDISDPFPTKVELIVTVAVDWANASQVLVYVAYPSKANPTVHQNYMFNSQSGAQLFRAERQDRADTLVYYEARIIGARGHVWTVPGSMTADSSLIILDSMPGHQVVRVRPEPVDFAARRIVEVNVQLRYADAKNGFNAESRCTLKQPSDSGTFEFDYVDPAIKPEYRADIVLDNGQTKALDWSQVGDGQVVIPLGQLD